MAETPLDLLIRLNRFLDYNVAHYRRLDNYLHGRQPISLLPTEILADIGDRMPAVNVNFARMVVDSLESRLDVAGFRVPDESVTSELWEVWQRNNLDEFSQLAHHEALSHGRSFVLVWADEQGYPRITVESGRQCVVWSMPGSVHRIAGLKRWVTPDGRAQATLFEPHQITRWQSPAKVALDPYMIESAQWAASTGYDPYSWADWSQIPATGWEQRSEPIANPLGVVPLIPLTNRPRILNWGESEIVDVIPLLDCITKLTVDMMVSSEYFAMPRRWVTGLEIKTDSEGKAIDPFSKQKGRNWLAEDPETKFGEFSTAELSNFVGAITNLTQQIGAIAGLPPHYLGISREPASADAIRSSEAPLVRKAQRKQRQFGGTWEQVMRIADLILHGYRRRGLAMMECKWVDAETRTIAASADAATKLTQIGVPLPQIAEDLGYSPQEIVHMAGVTANGSRLPDAPETQREIRGDEERGR